MILTAIDHRCALRQADLTAKLGKQFGPISVEKKLMLMQEQLDLFFSNNLGLDKQRIKVTTKDIDESDETTYFNVLNRTYTKRRSREEVLFMKHLLPIYKFIPRE